MVREDSLTGFNFPIPRLDTLRITKSNNFLKIGKAVYKPLKQTKNFYFPAKTMFYFDSNSISRQNPKGQYALISQGKTSATKALWLKRNPIKL